MKKLSILKALVLVLNLALCAQALAQPNAGSKGMQEPRAGAPTDSNKVVISPGAKTKVRGVILRRDDDNLIMRDEMGSTLNVRLSAATKLEEKKSNPFRSAKKYSQAQLIRGLNIEVEGRGDSSGALIADKIKFEDGDFRVALTVNSQVVPIEHRIGQTEDRLLRGEQSAERLSSQVEELGQVANLAKGGARAAQERADAAADGVNKTNDRITSLDDYEVRKSATINFRAGSALLTPEAKSELDQIANQAKSERGFVIEVRGFASSEGSETLNRRLSQHRAEAVVHYLAATHDIPLRRIVLPYGYGEARPVADNSTRSGREQNRRAEVKILVSRGLTNPVNVNGRTVGTNRQ